MTEKNNVKEKILRSAIALFLALILIIGECTPVMAVKFPWDWLFQKQDNKLEPLESTVKVDDNGNKYIEWTYTCKIIKEKSAAVKREEPEEAKLDRFFVTTKESGLGEPEIISVTKDGSSFPTPSTQGSSTYDNFTSKKEHIDLDSSDKFGTYIYKIKTPILEYRDHYTLDVNSVLSGKFKKGRTVNVGGVKRKLEKDEDIIVSLPQRGYISRETLENFDYDRRNKMDIETSIDEYRATYGEYLDKNRIIWSSSFINQDQYTANVSIDLTPDNSQTPKTFKVYYLKPGQDGYEIDNTRTKTYSDRTKIEVNDLPTGWILRAELETDVKKDGEHPYTDHYIKSTPNARVESFYAKAHIEKRWGENTKTSEKVDTNFTVKGGIYDMTIKIGKNENTSAVFTFVDKFNVSYKHSSQWDRINYEVNEEVPEGFKLIFKAENKHDLKYVFKNDKDAEDDDPQNPGSGNKKCSDYGVVSIEPVEINQYRYFSEGTRWYGHGGELRGKLKIPKDAGDGQSITLKMPKEIRFEAETNGKHIGTIQRDSTEIARIYLENDNTLRFRFNQNAKAKDDKDYEVDFVVGQTIGSKQHLTHKNNVEIEKDRQIYPVGIEPNVDKFYNESDPKKGELLSKDLPYKSQYHNYGGKLGSCGLKTLNINTKVHYEDQEYAKAIRHLNKYVIEEGSDYLVWEIVYNSNNDRLQTSDKDFYDFLGEHIELYNGNNKESLPKDVKLYVSNFGTIGGSYISGTEYQIYPKGGNAKVIGFTNNQKIYNSNKSKVYQLTFTVPNLGNQTLIARVKTRKLKPEIQNPDDPQNEKRYYYNHIQSMQSSRDGKEFLHTARYSPKKGRGIGAQTSQAIYRFEFQKTKLIKNNLGQISEAPLTEDSCEFTAIKKGGNHIATAISDKNGKVVFDKLEEGIYEIRETRTPTGYLTNQENFEIKIELPHVAEGQTAKEIIKYRKGNDKDWKDWDEKNLPTIVNKSAPKLKIRKIDALTGKPIKGAGFKLKKSTLSEGKVYEQTINEQGLSEFIFSSIELDEIQGANSKGLTKEAKYTLEETQVPEGYEKADDVLLDFEEKDGQLFIYHRRWSEDPNPQELEKEDGYYVFKVPNKKKSKIVLKKFDIYGNPLISSDAKFDLYAEDTNKSSNEIGGFDFSFTNESSDSRYTKKQYTFEDGTTMLARLTNSVLVTEATKFPAAATGWANTPEQSMGNGEITYEGLPDGRYFVMETKAPEGYEKLSHPVPFIIENGALKGSFPGYLPIINKRKKAEFTIKKTNLKGDSLKDVEFTLYKKDDNGDKIETGKIVKTTDESGIIKFTELDSGQYLLVETKPPKDLEVEGPWDVYVDDDKKVFVIDNEGKNLVKLIKLDNTDSIESPVVNIINTKKYNIVIRKRNNKQIETYLASKQKESGGAGGKNESQEEFNEKLKQWQQDYEKAVELIDLSITAGIYQPEKRQELIDNWLRDNPKPIKKLGINDATELDGNITSDNNSKKFTPLVAEFEVLKEDGSSFEPAKKGQTLSEGSGELKFENLKPGTYLLRETNAPEGGYLGIKGDYKFEITEEGIIKTLSNGEEVITDIPPSNKGKDLNIVVKNKKVKYRIKIIKVDYKTNEKIISSKQQARFKICDERGIQVGNQVANLSNGEFTFDNSGQGFKPGIYMLVEETAPKDETGNEYTKLPPIKIKIKSDGTIEVLDKNLEDFVELKEVAEDKGIRSADIQSGIRMRSLIDDEEKKKENKLENENINELKGLKAKDNNEENLVIENKRLEKALDELEIKEEDIRAKVEELENIKDSKKSSDFNKDNYKEDNKKLLNSKDEKSSNKKLNGSDKNSKSNSEKFSESNLNKATKLELTKSQLILDKDLKDARIELNEISKEKENLKEKINNINSYIDEVKENENSQEFNKISKDLKSYTDGLKENEKDNTDKSSLDKIDNSSKEDKSQITNGKVKESNSTKKESKENNAQSFSPKEETEEPSVMEKIKELYREKIIGENPEGAYLFDRSATDEEAELVGTIEIKIKNAFTKDFKISKTNKDGKKISGGKVSFKLTNDATGKELILKDQSTDKDIEFKNLIPGIYTLEETKAPVGYVKETKTYKVIVSASGVKVYEDYSNETSKPIQPSKIIKSKEFNNPQTNNPEKNALDNDENTYAVWQWFSGLNNDALPVNAWVGVDLGGLKNISYVLINMGRPDNPNDRFMHFAFEYSTDNVNWELFKEYKESENEQSVAHDNMNINARYLRLRNLSTDNRRTWIGIQDFIVYGKDINEVTMSSGRAATRSIDATLDSINVKENEVVKPKDNIKSSIDIDAAIENIERSPNYKEVKNVAEVDVRDRASGTKEFKFNFKNTDNPELDLKKIDKSGAEITNTNAKFELRKVDDNTSDNKNLNENSGEFVAKANIGRGNTVFLDENDTAYSDKKLPLGEYGKYILVEKEAPAGYKKLEKPILLELYEDKDNSKLKVVDKDSKEYVSITENGRITLKIKNFKDSDGEFAISKRIKGLENESSLALSGAEFKLSKDDDKAFNPIVKLINNNEPILFDGLKKGTYSLVETKAPEGYVKSGEYKVIVGESGNVKVFDLSQNSKDSSKKINLSKDNLIGSDRIIKSNINGQNTKDKIFDGNDNTAAQWNISGSTLNVGDFIGVDLKGYYEVNSIRFYQNPASIGAGNDKFAKFSLEYSLDGKTYTEISNHTNIESTATETKTENQSIKARYIRIINKEAAGGRWFMINEISVSGKSLSIKEINDSTKKDIKVEKELVKIGNIQNPKLELQKIDEKGNLISKNNKGNFTAKFKLYKVLDPSIREFTNETNFNESNKFKEIQELTLKNGKLKNTIQKADALGKYVLVETKAPNGYKKQAPIVLELVETRQTHSGNKKKGTTAWKVVGDTNSYTNEEGYPKFVGEKDFNQIKVDYSKLSDNKIILKVKNERNKTGNLHLKKAIKALGAADSIASFDNGREETVTFKLSKDNDNSFKEKEVTKKVTERIDFESLTPGSYSLEETKAPEGYIRKKSPYKVFVDEFGNTAVVEKAEDDKKITLSENNFIRSNDLVNASIQTGSISNIFDGDNSTKVQLNISGSTISKDAYIGVDLKALYHVKDIKFKHGPKDEDNSGNDAFDKFVIEYSIDGNSWYEASEEFINTNKGLNPNNKGVGRPNTVNDVEKNNQNIVARYIRFKNTEVASGRWLIIREIEIVGGKIGEEKTEGKAKYFDNFTGFIGNGLTDEVKLPNLENPFLELEKLDESGKLITNNNASKKYNAKFVLYKVDDKKTSVSDEELKNLTKVNGFDKKDEFILKGGKLEVNSKLGNKNLKTQGVDTLGRYLLVEEEAPDGYEKIKPILLDLVEAKKEIAAGFGVYLNATAWKFIDDNKKPDANGIYEFTDDKESGNVILDYSKLGQKTKEGIVKKSIIKIKVKNKKVTGSFILAKRIKGIVDLDVLKNDKLKAKFSLTKDGDNSFIKIEREGLVKDNFKFENLAEGTYTLAEETAPEGYVKENDPYKIGVDFRGDVHLFRFNGNEKTLGSGDITLSKTISGSVESESNAIDGNEDTQAIYKPNNSKVSRDEYLQVNLKDVYKLKSLKLLQDKNSPGGNDAFDNLLIEYSLDGKTFIPYKTYENQTKSGNRKPNTIATIEENNFNVYAKAIRFKSLEDSGARWIRINEIKLVGTKIDHYQKLAKENQESSKINLNDNLIKIGNIQNPELELQKIDKSTGNIINKNNKDKNFTAKFKLYKVLDESVLTFTNETNFSETSKFKEVQEFVLNAGKVETTQKADTLGKYVLVETETPDGYKKADPIVLELVETRQTHDGKKNKHTTAWKVVGDKSSYESDDKGYPIFKNDTEKGKDKEKDFDKIKVDYSNLSKNKIILKVKNESEAKKVKLKIKKVDEEDKLISGNSNTSARFFITNQNSTKEEDTLNGQKANLENGYFTFGENGKEFTEGLYYLVEKRAPKGYIKNSAPIPFYIKKDGTVIAPAKLNNGTYEVDKEHKLLKNELISVEQASGEDNTVTITIKNRKAEYPSTGGIGTLMFTIIGMSFMTIAGIRYMRRRSYDD